MKALLPLLLFQFISFAFLLTEIDCAEEIEARIRLSSDKSFIIETSDFSPEFNYIATAFYTPSLNEKGWDYLSISTNNIFSDELQSEAAGRLEASLTKNRIYTHYQNLLSTVGHLKDKTSEFLLNQENFILSKKSIYNEDPMLYNSYLLLLQIKGLREQYNMEMPSDKQIDAMEFNVVNAFGDIMDINDKFSKPEFDKMTNEMMEEYFFIRNHCTGLVKLKNDMKDIFFSHDSWYYYNMMTRIFKEYNFNFNHPSIKSHNILFSSYPGSIASNDDFYLTSKGLVITETTNTNYNTSSMDLINENSLLCWQRVQSANRISSNAKEWATNFIKYNSGTYNNQYVVLNMDKINFNGEGGPQIDDEGSLIIAEQMPGFCDIVDVSRNFKFGYFPSYNVPFSKKMQDYANYTQTLIDRPSLNSSIDYDKCTRANIIRRDHSKISNIDEMKNFMRYNDYENDPFSLGEPTNSIAARGDLRKKPICFGAFDTKLVSIKELKEGKEIEGGKMAVHLYSGPSKLAKPEFDFSKPGCEGIKHEGIPDTLDYDWIIFINKFEFNK